MSAMPPYNPRMPHVEINGAPATAGDLSIAMASYGHFTSMQVREGAVRGLSLHLQRLVQSTQQLFGSTLDTTRLRDWLRQALNRADASAAASVRVAIVSTSFDRERPESTQPVDVLIAVWPPIQRDVVPLRLQLRRYERDLPQVKHLATFGLLWQRREARLAGYDDALFENRDGCISEGSLWNVGFWDGAQIVWPQAPMLDGISQQLLKRALATAGLAGVTRELRRDELRHMRAAFICNSNAAAMPVGCIDEAVFSASTELAARLRNCHEGIAAEAI